MLSGRFKNNITFVFLYMFTSSTCYAYDFVVDSICYNIFDEEIKTCEVTSNRATGFYQGEVIIPSRVTYNDIVYNVVKIGDSAFKGKKNLTSIVIPNSVVDIGADAFQECEILANIEIPNTITIIRNNTFAYCKSLEDIIIPNSVDTIGSAVFLGCTGLSGIEIPNSVKSIGASAFANCENLTSVIIPNSLSFIDDFTFAYCPNLKSVDIPNSVTGIGYMSFRGCSSLNTVTIPNTIINVGADAFYETQWYNNQPDGMIYIGKVAYEYKGTMPSNTTVEIKDGTTCISPFAFWRCGGLVSIVIPNTVVNIGSGAFQECRSLKEISLPNSVKVMGWGNWVSQYGTFDGCNSLESVCISDISAFCGISFTQLGDSPLRYAKNLYQGGELVKHVIIPESVKEIKYTFSGCTNDFESITCYAITPPTLAADQFKDYSIPLYVPKGSVIKYKAAENWRNFVIIREISEEKDIYLGVKQANGEVRMKVNNENPCFSLQIKPDDGWHIHSVMLNDEDVTAEVAADGHYTTPSINSNSTLFVTYEKGSSSISRMTECQMRVFAFENTISIRDAEACERIVVYSVDGKEVATAITDSHGIVTMALPENQTYIVKGQAKTVKVRL